MCGMLKMIFSKLLSGFSFMNPRFLRSASRPHTGLLGVFLLQVFNKKPSKAVFGVINEGVV